MQSMRPLIRILFGLAVVFGLSGCGGDRDSSEPLVIYCAAGMKKPMDAIAKAYEEEYGVEFEIQYAGSGALMTMFQAANRGDIYLAADSSYTNEAKEKGLVKETMGVGFMTAGFGVPTGNPKNIGSLADLKKEGIRSAIGDPETASIGRFTKKVLSKNNAWEGYEPTAMTPTVNELANQVKLGAVDVAILWDAIARQYEEVDFVNIPEFDQEKKDITVAILTKSERPTEALKFCRYLTARDKGLKQFKADGYEVIEGDEWVEEPEITLYSGSMLRPAIKDSIEKFEEREGVRINTVYNGCGVLVANMKAGATPDAYFSCDIKFLDMVQERFEPSTVVTANDMVILVSKGNPKEIQTLDDLKKPDLRVGLCNPDKSALGYLTKNLLTNHGVHQDILDSGNLLSDAATGDFLINQMKSGSLDAAIVYRSNAMATASTLEDYDIVEIGRPDAIAEQPYAVAKNSSHQQLLARFLEACVSKEGKQDFLRHGFRWELEN